LSHQRSTTKCDETNHIIELLVALTALILATTGFLTDIYALIVLGLVAGAVSFGIVLGRTG
jgi:hypothetical protein